MFVQIEALCVGGDSSINFDKLGIEPPEDILEFKPLWVNLATVCDLDIALSDPNEAVIGLASGKHLQINMSVENFLCLVDAAGLLPRITNPLAKSA